VKVTCSTCEAVFSIPDERIPLGKTVRLTCLKCGNPILARATTEPEQSASADAGPAVRPTAPIVDLDSPESRRFDMVEEASPAALVCMQDPELLQAVSPTLTARGYHVRESADWQTACLWWEQNEYELAMVDDDPPPADPAQHPLLVFARGLPMSRRRKCMLCLFSRTLQTMDGVREFQLGLELIINRGDLDRTSLILNRAISEHRAAYTVFTEVGKERGLL
jgi:hypothetical protein